jgi:hypothetical protein
LDSGFDDAADGGASQPDAGTPDAGTGGDANELNDAEIDAPRDARNRDDAARPDAAVETDGAADAHHDAPDARAYDAPTGD